MSLDDDIDSVYRDNVVKGDIHSGFHEPDKPEIRSLLKRIQNSSGQSVTRNTVAALNSVTPPNENYMGIVLSGEGAGYYYRFDGAWVFGRKFPDSLVHLAVAGGTANAIVATSDRDLSGIAYDQLLTLGFEATNGAGGMTVAVDGEAARPLVTNTGQAIPEGYIQPGMAALIQLDEAGNYRLFSYGDAAAIQAAAELAAGIAEAFAAQAADYAALARNDFIWKDFTGDGVTTSFDLAVDPGSAQNVFAFIEGIRQTNFTLSGTVVTFDEAVPEPEPGANPKNVAFAFGYRVTVNTPADGSVTTPKLGNGAVTPEKMAQVMGVRNAVLNPRFLCNTRAVSGTVTLAAGARGHDCWKAGASGCTYTFTKTGNRVVLTISAGSLQQVVPGDDLEGGAYFLSWTGTAQGRINGGSYGASGAVSAAVTAGTNATIEFNTGTLSYPQFELGYVTKFDLRPSGEERSRVERWVRKIYFLVSAYMNAGAQDVYGVVNYPQMAATPTATLVGALTTSNASAPGPATVNDHYYNNFARSAAAGNTFVSGTYIISCEL